MASFVDPRGLYQSPVPLTTRVDVFARYLRLAGDSLASMRDAVAGLPSATALDLGCGIGVPLLPVGPTLFDHRGMVGVDLSHAQVTLVARELASRQLPCRLVTADGARLPFGSSTFDLVMARHMLYHFPDPSVAVAEVRRVLQEPGAMVATTNSARSRPELQDAHREAVQQLGGTLVERVSARFSAENGAELLGSFFDEVRTVPWHGVLLFPDVGAVLAYYRSATYFQRAFDEEAKRRQLAEEVGARLARLRTDEGIAVSVFGALFVAGRPRAGVAA